MQQSFQYLYVLHLPKISRNVSTQSLMQSGDKYTIPHHKSKTSGNYKRRATWLVQSVLSLDVWCLASFYRCNVVIALARFFVLTSINSMKYPELHIFLLLSLNRETLSFKKQLTAEHIRCLKENSCESTDNFLLTRNVYFLFISNLISISHVKGVITVTTHSVCNHMQYFWKLALTNCMYNKICMMECGYLSFHAVICVVILCSFFSKSSLCDIEAHRVRCWNLRNNLKVLMNVNMGGSMVERNVTFHQFQMVTLNTMTMTYLYPIINRVSMTRWLSTAVEMHYFLLHSILFNVEFDIVVAKCSYSFS